MKNEYKWYFPPKKKEIDEIWDKGILTLDANVLLDLYRYNESTRKNLIGCLENFEGRLWLSKQAANEFIRNRSNVIVDSNKIFDQARDQISKFSKNLETAVSQLRGNRIISDDIPSTLNEKVQPIIDNASKEIEESLSRHPNFLQKDPILDQIAELFKNSIGEPFEDETRNELLKEAEQRETDKVPPGYLDNDKDDERSYGDFFLWKEILKYSKNNSTPIILVTSEGKEDWWEIRSGQTIGPRYELLKEAYESTGQRILIYQTLNFLEYATSREGQELDDSTVEDIAAVDKLRSEDAVEVLSQNSITAGKNGQKGELVVELKRPVVNFTGSGHFEPRMDDVPNIRVSLLQCPEEVPSHKLSGGTGTKHDFNLHIRSLESEVLLPTGKYKFEYVAKLDTGNKKMFKVASEFNVSTQTIIDTLQEEGYDIVNKPNSKITPEMYEILKNSISSN